MIWIKRNKENSKMLYFILNILQAYSQLKAIVSWVIVQKMFKYFNI
jgi:hypothetical protein